MQLSVIDLEKMLTRDCTVETLDALREELTWRKAPRAAVLLAKVEVALRKRKTIVITKDEAADARYTAPVEPVRLPETKVVAPFQTASFPEVIATVGKGTLEYAKSLLGLKGSEPWADIERKRIALVNQAHPDRLVGASPEQAAAVRDKAQQVNQAFLIIAKAQEV
jgi:hypothetical protein